MEKVLVTGGAGYIGSLLTERLLKEGYEVNVVDNFLFRQHTLGHLVYHPKFNVLRGDVRNEGLMKEQIAKADIIVPLAAYVGAPLCDQDPVGASSINKDAIGSMLKSMSTSQRLIMPTTNSGYGVGDKDTVCTEESPLKPLSLYARDKVAVERWIMERENSISYRLATVFGMSPRMRLDLLVNDFVHRAMKDRAVVVFQGHFRRNYIHIRDLIDAFMFGIKNFDRMKSNAYNIGLSDANISKLDLCKRIAKHIPGFVYLEAPVGEDPDQRDYIVSNEKIEKLGFKTQVGLDDGIRELIKGLPMLRNSVHGNV